MAVRFDSGRIIKYEDTDDGFLRTYFRFRKIGDLHYRQLDGSERVEKVTADELYKRKSLRTAALKPITNGHPLGGMITPQNARTLQRGMTGNIIHRDDPYAMIVGVVTDAEMIDGIKAREMADVSSGYWSTPVRQDGAIFQTDVKYNHFAGCHLNWGRAGPDVNFLGFSTDSIDALEDKDIAVQYIDTAELDPNRPIIWAPFNFDHSDPTPKPKDKTMTITSIKIDDKTTINVGSSEGEQAIASYLRATLDDLNTLTEELASLQEKVGKIDQLSSDLSQVKTNLAEEKTRADLAQKQLSEKPSEDTLKQVKQDGYNRRRLEEAAEKLLPPNIKIDSNWSDRQIQEAVILHRLGLRQDSTEAKQFKDFDDRQLDGSYRVVVSQDSSTALRVAANDAKPEDGGDMNRDAKNDKAPNHKKPLRYTAKTMEMMNR